MTNLRLLIVFSIHAHPSAPLPPCLFGTKRNGDTVTLTDARSFVIRVI